VLLTQLASRDENRGYLEKTAELLRAGIPLYPQTACRPVVFECAFSQPTPLANWEVLQGFRGAGSVEQKRVLYADAALRERMKGVLAGALNRDGTPGGGPREDPVRLTGFAMIELSWYPPDPALEGQPLAAIAAARGRHAVDMLFDLALASGLEGRFRIPMANYAEDELGDILRDPNVVLGLGDGGAHISQLCDACYPTHLLGHWVRKKQLLSLERAVHMLTARPADIYGLTDRGRLAAGRPADVVVFEPDTVDAGPLERVRDQPAGAARVVSRPRGIREVLVNGHMLCGGATRAGRLLRGGRAPA